MINSRRFLSERIFEIGYGAMPLSLLGRPDRLERRRTLDQLEASPIRLIDTALGYGLDEAELGHNEKLIGEFLKQSSRNDWLVATKGGAIRSRQDWIVDGRPQSILRHCDESLKNLAVDAIDLYQLHSPDPSVPIEETIGALKKLQEQGKIKYIGLCNFTKGEIVRAVSVAKIASVQNELNVFNPEDLNSGLVSLCQKLDIAYLAHGPVGGYLRHREMHLSAGMLDLAENWDVPSHELMLQWLLNASPIVIPIPGASREQSLRSSIRASEAKPNLLALKALEELALELSDFRRK